ncbi:MULTISPECIES: molybdopterin-synthase adenylyltransferase MoeB [unclassified Prochlorococcus]|uniref:molybdopterin-synthase adenylyltransferase MoeB n=1 Tax=unclassified Prochlorococcus TaxID=2627481 RepID=UPI000533826F|nr:MULTISPECIES: molybdopterin-synthase adenylyltransferase MoeB [unclassified Prochlorococcus]KGG14664.1 Sulfur carrier protein adenylyltransferase ThiF [Prochlorococcus sp. MIT 0602]KGG15906.1 Sulfur carrier protein adenylyltransferase ThiF [Prochlorococcus sp. MIT 0603]
MNLQNKESFKLNSDELERFARHLVLPEIGESGQQKLKNSSVICIGSGGLGSSLLLYLAGAGIGNIGIVDSDIVEKSNLQRQIIHSTSSIGQLKIISAKSRILGINPNCNVQIFDTLLTDKNALEIINQFDVICDCTDNFESRYLVNDVSTILGKPNVYGAIARFEGQSTVFNLNKNSPNFRDLIPIPPPKDLLPSCSEAGVLGILPGIIGIIQATESIKIITGIGEILDGRVLVFDALRMKFKELSLKKNKSNPTIKKLSNYKNIYTQKNNVQSSIKNISVQQLKNLIDNNNSDILLLDVRTLVENKIQSISSSILIPLENLTNKEDIEKINNIALKKTVYVHCKSGSRSVKAIEILGKHGIQAINVLGGIDAWNKAGFQMKSSI